MAETASNHGSSRNAVIVHQWLEGIGLHYAWHQFEAAGIVTPDALAELESQHFAALSVTASEDRRKLFFLVQRVKLELEQQRQQRQQQKNQSSNPIAKSKENYKPQEVTVTLDSPVEQDQFFDSATGSEELDCTTEDEEEEEADQDYVDKAYLAEPEIVAEEFPARHTRQSARLQQQQQSTTAEPPISVAHQNPTPNKSHNARISSARITKKANYDKNTSDSSCSSLEVKRNTSATISGKQKGSASGTTQSVQLNGLSSIMSMSTSAMTPSSPSSDRAASTAKLSSPRSRNMQTQIQPDAAVDGNNGTFSRSASDILDDALQSDNEAASSAQINNYNDSSKLAKPRRSSGLVAPAQRETKHARTNPSMRTGKQLSAIPADTVPPMSPLIELQLSETADGSAHQRNNKKSMRRRSGSLDGAIKRQLATTTTSKSADNSFADCDGTDDLSVSSTQSRRRRTSLTQSGSDRSLTTSSRQSLARTSSDRSLSSTGSSSSYNHRPRRRASIASSKPASSTTARRSLGPRTSSSVESTNHSRSSGMSHSNTSRTLGWKDKIELLRAENTADFEVFHGSAHQPAKNRYELDDDDSNEMRIRVVVRKRPMSSAEIAAAGDIDIIHPLDYQEYGRILVYQPKQRVDLTKSIETIPFAFDNTFDCHATNADIYERSVRNLIPSLFEGQWASIFAYGQTGSGKTFTMMGNNFTGMNSKDSTRNNDVTNLGLYYMAALDLFHAIKTPGFEHFTIAVSLFEIYGGKLFDLLNGRALVKCLEDAKGKVCFPGLSEHQVDHPDDLISMIELGASHRSTGTTSRNADSSRSHAVLQLHLCQRDARRRGGTEFSRLTFIDLAGSERGADTSTASRATRLEGAEINTSLLALKEVIRALATGDSLSHVPFRGSKLTQVLKESFVGKNGRSVMIACISPNIVNCEQTLNTLRYADRVKERNPETGEMGIKAAASMKNSSAKTKTPPRLKLSANVSLSQPTEVDDNSISNYSFSNNSAVLDELLAPSPSGYSEDFVVSVAAAPSQSFAVLENEDAQDHMQCMEELIATHKDAMAVCLDQIKEEMMLVNQADANREELMEEYMRKIFTIQDEQLAMITLLREQLLQFRVAQAKAQVSNDDNDNDSFEDLRED